MKENKKQFGRKIWNKENGIWDTGNHSAILLVMDSFLQKISAIIFYIFGIIFFLAYLLYRNTIISPWPEIVLSICDLPLILSGMLYGGSSLYLSIKSPKQKSKALLLGISIPLIIIFLILIVMNFWKVFI